MRELETLLEHYNYQYYVENSPEVSDYEFDRLLRELQDLEAKHPQMPTLTPLHDVWALT